jgi:hypothetical protein
MTSLEKDPRAELTYTEDWNDYVAELGEDVTIADSEWIVPEELTNIADSLEGNIASIKLKEGYRGKDYVVTNLVTTSTGEKEVRSILIKVRDQ